MGEYSGISWTDHSFNPWVGCLKVSPGCKNCYAERDMTRKGRWANTWGPAETTERLRTSDDNWKKPLRWNEDTWKACTCGWRGSKKDLLPQPMPHYPLACPSCGRGHALKDTRQRVFCASLGDVFEDNDTLLDWRSDMWDLIELTPNLDWLLLTKRPENIHKFTRRWWTWDHLPSNIWLGVSVENQEWADKRREDFRAIPAQIKFVSYEPSLGPVNWSGWEFINWLISGGESGTRARPTHPDWLRGARDWAVENGIAYHLKQWGEWLPLNSFPSENNHPLLCRVSPMGDWYTSDNYKGEQVVYSSILRDKNWHLMAKVGKHAAGRLLDGQEWNEFPKGLNHASH